MRDGELDAKRWIITEQKLWYLLRATATRGTVSLGAWFGFAFLAAVICELCGKEELNREERQGFAKEAKQVLGPRGKLRPTRLQMHFALAVQLMQNRRSSCILE